MAVELTPDTAKAIIAPLREALYHNDLEAYRIASDSCFAPDATIHLGHPFETLAGPEALLTAAIAPLAAAFPDLERRDMIVLAGKADTGTYWVGCCGYFTGTFTRPFLDIPPTGHHASMRFHEFYRIEDGHVSEFQGVWDIPELMLQAGAWPMTPSLGREWLVPSPATQDGLSMVTKSSDHSQQSQDLVSAMIDGLSQYATGGVAAMQLEKYWHPHFSWYGPSGIGTTRGIDGFRNWHQIPFLNGMPDRVGGEEGGFFAESDYVAFTAWPGMHATISGDGWMGIAASGQKITMRSLDFWRCENGLIRENWVLVDLLHVYHQIGVDVLGRMREFNKARG